MKKGIFTFIIILSIIACNKDPILKDHKDKQLNYNALMVDSVYMLASSLYLWNDQLPPYSSFHPENHIGFDLEHSLRNSLAHISTFARDPETNARYEQVDNPLDNKPKYSTFSPRNEQHTANPNFGMKLGLDKTTGEFKVMYVLENSPADRAAIKRSYLLTTINGKNLKGLDRADSYVASTLNTSAQCTFIFKNKLGHSIPVELHKNTYNTSPVAKDTVFEQSGKQIGYLRLHSFPAVMAIRNELDQVFTSFNNKQVEGLIIDLRYNGGGNISSVRYLANLIAPRSISGQKMYALAYNKNLKEGKTSYLADFYVKISNGERIKNDFGAWMSFADYDFSMEENTYFFSKKGGLNTLKKIVFIVSEHTASASEMLINSLQPHMNITLVGQRTYGKPVGFFAVPIGEYDFYLSAFLTTNAEGKANYFKGIAVDKKANDNINFDFMDPQEDCLKQSLSLFQITSPKKRSAPQFALNEIKMLNSEPIKALVNDVITP